MESGKSAALAGMIKNVSYKLFDKEPTAAQLSIFSIYHSKDFQSDKSQFIMFITPQIVEDASKGSNELKRKFRVK